MTVNDLTIAQHFLMAFERPSSWKALRFKRHKSWVELSWQDYFRRAEAVALALRDSGIVQGDRVAILSNTRWEWAAADFGILGLGAVTVPVYQSNRADEIEFVLKDAEPKAILLEDLSQLRKWETIAKRCKSIETVVCIQPGSDPLPESIQSWDEFLERGSRLAKDMPNAFAESINKGQRSDLASLVYTSGTTGEPRGVRLTHTQIMSEVEDLVRTFPISHNDSTLTFLPYAHVLGRVELWLHTYLGFNMTFAESIEKLRFNLQETHPTVIIGVPRIFEKIYSAVTAELQSTPLRQKFFKWLEPSPRTLAGRLLNVPKQLMLDRILYEKVRVGLGGQLRFAVSGGAPLEAEIGKFFKEAGLLVLEGYGLTETTAAITVNTPENYLFGSVGKPLPDVQIRIADDGEILVKSKKVTAGYWRENVDGQSPFKDGYFCTGDIGEFDGKGFLKITDRKKDLIKTAGGKYVAPQKIEGLLKLDPLISNVLIHGDRKKYVVALMTLDEPMLKRAARENNWTYRDYRSLTQSTEVYERLRQTVAKVNSSLASYETVKNFAILPNDFSVESGELTPSLKVKRRVCDERYSAQIASLY